jgi:hypothetical protein
MSIPGERRINRHLNGMLKGLCQPFILVFKYLVVDISFASLSGGGVSSSSLRNLIYWSKKIPRRTLLF